MSSSPIAEPSTPLHASTPIYVGKKQHQPLNVVLPQTPLTPTNVIPGEPTLTPPPRSPGVPPSPAGDLSATPAPPAPPPAPHASQAAPDGTSSDKSSETAVAPLAATPGVPLSRKESYKAQRQHYRREKKRAASALLHSIDDPAVVVLADWLKVRGSLKSWTKLWCVLKPGLLLLYKSPKAKSSHWVGTVLLTSCQVIERPSKKDGFCFKLYHPLEQSIWAPRGPHNETIGAVVQPLPTAHLIFRAPSQAAGHCWLDGLELALRCSNAMLRCGKPQPEAAADVTQPSLSHEELEKHFNEHVRKMSDASFTLPAPLMSVSDYASQMASYYEKPAPAPMKAEAKRKVSKWTQFVETIDILKDSSSDSEMLERDRDYGLLDFLRKREIFERKASTASMRVSADQKRVESGYNASKSLASSPMKNALECMVKRPPILRCFEMPKLQLPLGDRKAEKKRGRGLSLSPTNIIEENLLKIVTAFPKRRSSTPSVAKNQSQKRTSQLPVSGAKTDSENDYFRKSKRLKNRVDGKIVCTTPDDFVITKTAPSVEEFRNHSTSSTDEIGGPEKSVHRSPYKGQNTPEKYSLIDYRRLPSTSLAALNQTRKGEILANQNVYVAGHIVRSCELADAASESDSEGSRGMPEVARPRPQEVLARLHDNYVEDPNRETGAAGEVVEEIAEENKSLLWFLLKQVRPGMDLSKVVLPTFILEPRSFLDKLSDSYYHADILAQAQFLEDPYQRFKCVLRWYLSGLYRKPKGLKKPYNPVLGETFRCCWRHPDTDTTTYYIAEQVSHHPPVSAFYVSNRKEGFVIQGSLLARSKFYGNSTSAILEGCARVHLLQWDETYVTTAPYAHCKGLVIGTLSMELGGKVHVICNDTGYSADVEFKLRSFLGGADQTNAISGRIRKGKDTVATLDGYWDGRIDIRDKKSGEEATLLDCAILKQHRLPRYLMKLDRQLDHESERLWLGVSEAIANDDQVAATEEKTVIEEAQRERAKNVSSPWVPRIFQKELYGIPPPEGVIDQAWKYNYSNTLPWQPDEVLEYEEDFVIQSLTSGTPSVPRVASALHAGASRVTLPPSQRASEHRESLSGMLHKVGSDSESADHDDRHRHSKTSTRTLKQTLYAIDASLKEQAIAIERLTKAVETIGDSQRSSPSARPVNVGRMPQASHIWDLFGGFVLAIVLQALLNWLFYHKD